MSSSLSLPATLAPIQTHGSTISGAVRQFHFNPKAPVFTPPRPQCPPVRPNTTPRFQVPDVTQIPLINSPSPFHRAIWERRLRHYPDDLGTLLSESIAFGVQLGYEGPAQRILSNNLTSASLSGEVITQQVSSDLGLGRITPVVPTEKFISSPLGLVPKHDGGFRRIHHLSHPAEKSVNDHIPGEYSAISYTKLSDILDAILHLGRGTVLVKRDIQSAFRTVPVSLRWRWLLGFFWEGQYYVENCLSFGLATAPFIFNLFAEGLHWMLQAHLGWTVFHYLDDFISLFPPGSSSVTIQTAARDYSDLALELGIPENTSKNVEGTTADLLGIEVDTMLLQARLPEKKLKKALHLIDSLLATGTATLFEAQSVTGLLQFCSQVIILGRTFIRRIWDFISTFHCQNYAPRRRLTHGAVRDLQWWRNTLPVANGVLFFDAINRSKFSLRTDACPSGIGGYFTTPSDENPRMDQAFAEPVPNHQRHRDISVIEARALEGAFERWAPLWAHSELLVFTDNTTLFSGLLNATSRGPIMDPLRRILVKAASLDITIRPEWLSSSSNAIADALSRFDAKRLADLCPQWSNIQEFLHHRNGSLTSVSTTSRPNSCGTDSPLIRAAITTAQYANTKKFADFTVSHPGPQPYNPSPSGWVSGPQDPLETGANSSTLPSSRTSPLSSPIAPNAALNGECLTATSSSVWSRVPRSSSHPQEKKSCQSQRTSSTSLLRLSPPPTPSPKPTSMPRSPLLTVGFSEWENLQLTRKTRQQRLPRIDLREETFLSPRMTRTSRCASKPASPTDTTKASRSTSRPLKTAAPYNASVVCSNWIPRHRQTNLSSGLKMDVSSRQAVKAWSPASRLASAAPALTDPCIQVTPFAKERRRMLTSTALRSMTFRSSAAGSQTPLRDTINSVLSVFSH
jgi:hypothetical protein